MVTDVPSCPVNIGALGAEAVVFVTDALAQLIEQFGLSFWYRVGHALFRLYLLLPICTVSWQRQAPRGLRAIKQLCITAVAAHNGRRLPVK